MQPIVQATPKIAPSDEMITADGPRNRISASTRITPFARYWNLRSPSCEALLITKRIGISPVRPTS